MLAYRNHTKQGFRINGNMHGLPNLVDFCFYYIPSSKQADMCFRSHWLLKHIAKHELNPMVQRFKSALN